MRTFYRTFARCAFLSVLGMLGVSCYILADTFFIARGMGADGLAALNIAIPVYNLINGCGLMLGMGGAIQYALAQERGARTDAAFTHAAALALGGGAAFAVAGLTAARPIAAMLGAQGRVLALTETYLRVLMAFSPAFMMNAVLLCFVRNDGAPGRAAAATLAGSFSNIVLDYVLIFPLNMGMLGAVLATGVSPVISMLVMLPHRGRSGFRLVRTRPCVRTLRRMFALGVPSLIEQMAAGVALVVFNLLILRLEGNVGVAAYGVVANLSLVMAGVFSGVAQGVQPLSSCAYGSGNGADVRRLLRCALATVLTAAAAMYALIFAFAHPIAAAFNGEGNAALAELAVTGLRLYFLCAAFMGANTVLAAHFTAIERTRPAHALSLLRGFVLLVPLALALSGLLGMTGVWLTCPATEGLTAALGAAWIAREKRSTLEES